MRKLRDGVHNFVVTDVNVITRRMGYLTCTKKSNDLYVISETLVTRNTKHC